MCLVTIGIVNNRASYRYLTISTCLALLLQSLICLCNRTPQATMPIECLGEKVPGRMNLKTIEKYVETLRDVANHLGASGYVGSNASWETHFVFYICF